MRLRESTHPLLGRFRVVFLREGPRDGVAESLAPAWPGTDGDLAPRKLDAPYRLGLKGTIPSGRLVIPGPYERPPLDHNDPYAGVAVFAPRADAEDLRLGKLLDDGLRESSCDRHCLNSALLAPESLHAGG